MKKNFRKFLSIIIALAMIIIPSIKTNTVYAGTAHTEDTDGTSGKLQINYKNLADKLDKEFGENSWKLSITNQEKTIEINSSTDNMQFDSPYGDTVNVRIEAGAAKISGTGAVKQDNEITPFTVEDNEFNFTIIEEKSPTAQFKDLNLIYDDEDNDEEEEEDEDEDEDEDEEYEDDED